jgi:general stress protein 26
MTAQSADDLRSRFWSEIEKVRTGMLGIIEGEEGRFQPMTAHFDDQRGIFWFYARASSPFADAADGGSTATFAYTGQGHDLYACIRGRLSSETDASVRQQFWTEDVARWFPAGPGSDEVAMLRFEADSAQVWRPSDAEDAGHLSFGGRSAPQDVHAGVAL